MTIREFIDEWNSNTDFILAHTSGSTGVPKEIRLSKTLVAESAKRTIDFFSLNSQSRLHLCLSVDYIAGKMMIIRSILSNSRLTFEEPSNSLHLLPEGRIDLLAVVPSQLIGLLDDDAKLQKIGNIIIGGSAIPTELRQHVANSKLNAYETYGMTETASHVALRKIENDDTLPYFALPGIEFTIDENSCLVIKMNGFDVITTNDIVHLLDCRHFRLIGRKDDVINSGGVKIHPAEVENKISEVLKGNFHFCISSLPHSKWGEEVVLVVDELCNLSDADLHSAIATADLSSYQTPKRILRIKELPITDSGKIRRSYLKNTLSAHSNN